MPENGNDTHPIAHALTVRGDLAEALVHFRNAVRLEPDDRAFRDALEEAERHKQPGQ